MLYTHAIHGLKYGCSGTPPQCEGATAKIVATEALPPQSFAPLNGSKLCSLDPLLRGSRVVVVASSYPIAIVNARHSHTASLATNAQRLAVESQVQNVHV